MTTNNRKENYLNRDECDENTKQEVYIWDVTLREGEQAPGITFNLKDKMEIASFMSEIGVHSIDIAFPSKSFQEQEFVREIVARNLNITVNATAMNSVIDIDLCSELGIKESNVLLPMNILSAETGFEAASPNSFSTLKKVLNHAFKKNISVNLVGIDASRVDPAYVADIFKFGFDLGAQRFVICDTVGKMEPFRMGEFVSDILNRMPRQAELAIHCHNNFGLATANTLAAIDAGVKYATATLNGLGDRAGNASLEEVVLALEKIHKKRTGINLKRLFELSKLVEKISVLPTLITKPITGHNLTGHALDNSETDPIELDNIMQKIREYLSNQSELEKENYSHLISEYNRKHLDYPMDVIKRILHESIRR